MFVETLAEKAQTGKLFTTRFLTELIRVAFSGQGILILTEAGVPDLRNAEIITSRFGRWLFPPDFVALSVT